MLNVCLQSTDDNVVRLEVAVDDLTAVHLFDDVQKLYDDVDYEPLRYEIVILLQKVHEVLLKVTQKSHNGFTVHFWCDTK